MRIDAHHHFWKYNPAEYDWIGENMGAIRRDFLPADLQQELAAADIDGVVSVQARQSLEETEWLLKLAGENPFIKGVVGWVPLISDTVESDLERFAANPLLRGVRHVLQGEPDENYILREDFNRGIRAVTRHGLAYDLLIQPQHLPQTIQFVDLHPQQTFILDHLAKPDIRHRTFEPWNQQIRELARRENVFCKLSGMITEADWSKWQEADLHPYAETVLDAFGPERTMFGSDWPVCLVACDYLKWRNAARRFAMKFSASEQDWFFGKTAARAYQLSQFS